MNTSTPQTTVETVAKPQKRQHFFFLTTNHNNFLQEVYTARKLQNKKQNVMIPVMK